jgi:hypothetical protein
MSPHDLLELAYLYSGDLDRVIVIAFDKDGEGHYATSSDDETQIAKDIAKFKRDQRK